MLQNVTRNLSLQVAPLSKIKFFKLFLNDNTVFTFFVTLICWPNIFSISERDWDPGLKTKRLVLRSSTMGLNMWFNCKWISAPPQENLILILTLKFFELIAFEMYLLILEYPVSLHYKNDIRLCLTNNCNHYSNFV